MSKFDDKYYLESNFLLSAMSLYHFIFDDVMTSELLESSRTWSRQFEQVASWVGDNGYWSKYPILRKGNFVFTDKVSTHFEYLWADKLNGIAQDAYLRQAKLPLSTYLYSAYCLWLTKILDKFSKLLEEYGYGKYRKSYQEIGSSVDELRRLLQQTVSHHQIQQVDPGLWDTLETQTVLFANEWEQAVQTATENGFSTDLA